MVSADDRAVVNQILDYWYEGVIPKDKNGQWELMKSNQSAIGKWFRKDSAVDKFIKDTFEKHLIEVADGKYEVWKKDAWAGLAAVIMMDQFSRNMYRNQAKAFAFDGISVAICRYMLADANNSKLNVLPYQMRSALFMPFMHTESLEAQDRCMELYKQLQSTLEESALGRARTEDEEVQYNRLPGGVNFGRKHKDLIIKFGRFPGRNAALGRVSTTEEKTHLAEHGSF